MRRMHAFDMPQALHFAVKPPLSGGSFSGLSDSASGSLCPSMANRPHSAYLRA